MACVALGITLLTTGCKKDEVKDTFNLNAVIEEVNSGQKVHMEGFLPCVGQQRCHQGEQ